MASAVNSPNHNGIIVKTTAFSTQGQPFVDPRIAKLAAQGITFIAEKQSEEIEKRTHLEKAESLYAEAEFLSRDIEGLIHLAMDLKDPTIPHSLFCDHFKENAPKELVDAIRSCLQIAFPKEGIKKLFSRPRILLQVKNATGTNILDHYLSSQKLKIQEIRELANLHGALASGKVNLDEEEDHYKKIETHPSLRHPPFQFSPSYLLGEEIKETDTLATAWNILKLYQLQDFYTFLNSPEYSKEFIFKKFQELDCELKTALGHAVWAACYQSDELYFVDHLLATNPRILLECKNFEGIDVVIQFTDHYKTKIHLQRFKTELSTFTQNLEVTTDREDQRKLFQSLPKFARVDLADLVWHEHGRKADPTFGHPEYGDSQIEKDPCVLTYRPVSLTEEPCSSILDIYSNILEQKINYDIRVGAYRFTKEMTLPDEPIDCSVKDLTLEIPPQMRVAMITAEYTDVISMGGLAPAVQGMAHAYGRDKVCIVLPKYDVINPDIILKEKLKYRIELRDAAHSVFRAKVNGVTCYLIEDALFNVGYNPEGNPNNIYHGSDLQIKRRWAIFQSLSAELVYKLSKKQKNPIEIVQVHDTQASLVPKILSHRYFDEWKAGRTPATVFTFHNNISLISFDDPEALAILSEIGLPSTPINSFIEGLENSDMNTTVSETFAKEVQTKFYGKGIERYTKINASKGKLNGIANGNTEGWDPSTDPQLKNWITMEGIPLDLTYGPDDIDLPEKTKRIREQLVQTLRFHNLADIDPTRPIFFFVGRYDLYQKGIDKFQIIMEEALANEAQFISIGVDTDSEKVDEILTQMQQFATKRENRGVCIIRDFKRRDGRLYWQHGNSLEDTSGIQGFGSALRAAVDVGIFPSMSEPFGLVIGEMHRMGVETAATGTGGFMDTIITYGPHRNGYLFPRLPVWGSSSQDNAIKMTIREAAARTREKLDALYHNDLVRLSPYIEQKRTLMRNAAGSSWTRTFDGSLTPIKRIEQSYGKALINRKNRGPIHLEMHALGSSTFRLAEPPPQPNFGFIPNLHETLGAHFDRHTGKTTFRVYAPRAKEILLNLSSGDRVEEIISLDKKAKGIWEAQTNFAKPGRLYHYMIFGPFNSTPIRKVDPFAFGNHVHTHSHEHASVVCDIDQEFPWSDELWMASRVNFDPSKTPMPIYEVHPPTWRKNENGDPLNWRELAAELGEYCQDMGYTHIELMALFEHPAPVSMGYQITNFFALNSEMGSIEDFQYFVNDLHNRKIGVIADWVPAHFAIDPFALCLFDGTPLLEDDDPDFASHPNWGTYEFDFKKQYTKDFLGSNLHFLLEKFHLDGIRVDAVQSMLELNYGRVGGTRLNAIGGHVNLDAKAFLRNINTYVHQKYPGVLMIAEEAMGFPNLTRPVDQRGVHTKTRGVGFDMTWHMGFMRNILDYMATPPHHRASTFPNFVRTVEDVDYNEDSRPRGKVVLPFSHDESANGNGTIFTKMGGNSDPDKFANGRLLLAYQALRGGGPLLEFMGNEILQTQEWHGRLKRGLVDPAEKKKATVQWEELDPDVNGLRYQYHRGARESRRAMLHLYRDNPALHDQTHAGISWIDARDSENGVLSFHRRGSGQQFACIFNSSDKDLKEYTLALPDASYAPELSRLVGIKEIYNTDAVLFGGLGRQNASIEIIRDAASNRPTHLKLHLPPFTALVLEEEFHR
jgi:1,4-alpha-glucan branching enzyme